MTGPEDSRARPAFGEIITFYSYKGGTGRSMALANVGYVLATDPEFGKRKVLMIDWDLEAPGLQRFFQRDFSNAFGSPDRPAYTEKLETALGLIDYLTDIRDHYREHAPSEGLPVRTAWDEEGQRVFQAATRRYPLKEYVIALDTPQLFLMKAGQLRKPKGKSDEGPSYSDKVRAFDWEEFTSRYGSFLTLFREMLMKEYGYTLVDSRTGLTDTSGVCTRVMPEKLVAVFVPNYQNVDGTLGVVRRAATFRMKSRGPRVLLVFPLASRIDGSASRLRTLWWRGGELDGEVVVGYQKRFEDLFVELFELDECDLGTYFNDTQIPHDSDYAYGEKVAAKVDTSDSRSIGHACRNLASYLVNRSVPWETASTEDAEPQAEIRPGPSTAPGVTEHRVYDELRRVLLAVSLDVALFAAGLGVYLTSDIAWYWVVVATVALWIVWHQTVRRLRDEVRRSAEKSV